LSACLLAGCQAPAPGEKEALSSGPEKVSGFDKYKRVSPLEIDPDLSADVLAQMTKSLEEILPPIPSDWAKINEPVDFEEAAGVESKDAYKLYLAGNLLLRKGQPAEALTVLREALGYDPNSAILLERAGIACYQSKQIEAARDYLKNSLKYDSTRMVPHSYLGDIYRNDGKVSETLSHYQKALACPQALAENPETAIVYFKLADLLAQENHLKAALTAYANYHRLMDRQRQFSQINPLLRRMVHQFHASWLAVAAIQLRLGNLEDCYQALREINPQSPDAAISYLMSMLLGQQMHRDVKYRQVMYFCRFLIARNINPEHALGLYYGASKELAKVKDYERRLSLWSERDESGRIILSPRNHALGLSLMGRDDVAKVILLKQIDKGERSERVYRDLAEISGRYHQWEDAVLAYGNALHLNWNLMGEMKQWVDDKKDQIPDPNSAHPIWQDNNEALAAHAEAMYVLGAVAAEKGYGEVAQKCLKMCLDVSPKFIPGQIAWLDLLHRWSRYEDIDRWIRGRGRQSENDDGTMTAEQGGSPEHTLRLWYAGQAAMGKGEMEEARRSFQQLLFLRPDSTRVHLAIAETFKGQGMFATQEKRLLEILDSARFFTRKERQSRSADPKREVESMFLPWEATVDRDTVLLNLIKVYCRWNASLEMADPLRNSTGKRAGELVPQWLAARRNVSGGGNKDSYDILTEELEGLRDRNDNGRITRSLLTKLYATKQRFEEAEFEVEALLSLEPEDQEILSLAAETYERAGKLDRAAAYRLRLWDQEKDNVRLMLRALSTLRRGAQEERAWGLLEENLKNQEFLDHTDIQILFPEAMALIKVTRLYDQGASGFEHWYRYSLENHKFREDLIVALANNLAWLWMQLDRHDQADALLRYVYSEFRVENVNMALRLCRLWVLEQQFERAEQLCGYLKDLRPDDVNVRYQFYSTMIDAGKSEQALIDAGTWVAGLSEEESVTQGRKTLLLLYRQAGTYIEALEQLERWQPDSPESEFAYYRFDFLLLAGKEAEAEEFLSGLEASGKASIELLNARIRLCIHRDDVSEAVNALDRFTQDADTAEVYLLKSQIYDNAGQPDESLLQMKKVVALVEADTGSSPRDNLDIRLRYCVLLEQCGRVDEAIEHLKALLKEHPKNGVVKNNLGYVLVEKGAEIDTIESYLLDAHRANPDSAPTLDSLGWFYYKKGDYATAYRYILQAVLEMGRGDPEVLDHLGDVVYRMGKTTLAEKYWKLSSEQLIRESGSNRGVLGAKDRVLNKLKQIEQGDDVEVTPLFEN
jgi:tetratricopeptide (TPR) repeat protein